MAQRVDSSQPQAHRSPTRFLSIDPRTGDVVAYHQMNDEAAVHAVVARAREAAEWWARAWIRPKACGLLSGRSASLRHVRSSPLTARPGRSSYCCGLSESFIRVLGVAQREGRR
jgi:hypothetical protein